MWFDRLIPKRSAEERKADVSEAALGVVISFLCAAIGGLVLYLFGEALFAGGPWMQALGIIAIGSAVIGAYAFCASLFSFGIAATIGLNWALAILVLGWIMAKLFGYLD